MPFFVCYIDNLTRFDQNKGVKKKKFPTGK